MSESRDDRALVLPIAGQLMAFAPFGCEAERLLSIEGHFCDVGRK